MSNIVQDAYEMTNLYPRHTGLPMTVWVSPRGCAWHAARVKVHMAHGDPTPPLSPWLLRHAWLPAISRAMIRSWCSRG